MTRRHSLLLAIAAGLLSLLGLLALTANGGGPARADEPRALLSDSAAPPTATVKLVFVHHSCGDNWLSTGNGGLGDALGANNYFVSDTYYGWGPDGIGSSTDIGHWWLWFRGPHSPTYTQALYETTNQHATYTRPMSDPGGENQIIMFKSCFPNSHLGGNPDDPPTTGDNPLRGQSSSSAYHTVANAKGIYNDLLVYFAAHRDKLFIVVTAPPLMESDTDASHAANARAFNDWLVNDWLTGYPYSNVAVFDFYNVLTSNGGSTRTNDPYTNDAGQADGNHHRWLTTTNAVQHIHTVAHNYSAYADGDSHPTAAGNQKATAEFVPLLNVFYNRWRSGAAACTPLTGLSLTGPTTGYTGTRYTFTAHPAPVTASLPITATWTPSPTAGGVLTASYTWATTGVKTITIAAENCGGHTFAATHTIAIAARGQTVRYPVYLPVVLRAYNPRPPACPRPLTGVAIDGPVSGTLTLYTFTASITPTDATPPITYTWSPTPASGQGTATASYRWATTGTHTVSVTAVNCGGTASDTHAVTVTGSATGSLVMPADLTYLGAFRLPGGEDRPQTFAYGGNAMTFNPDGDPGNSDAFPGSLFITGHDRIAYGELPDGDQIAEVSIPTPTVAVSPSGLLQASFIQPFHDVLTGYFTSLEEIPRIGMQYLDHPDTGPLIHLCWGQHLQDPAPSHAWFSPTLASSVVHGVWYIGNQSPYSVNGYLFDIPTTWADAYAQGRYLATGRFRDGGMGGMGPALFAYRPWLTGGRPPVSGTRLSETVLLLYEKSTNTETITHCLNGYQHPDEWEGGAWLTTPSGKEAVLFAGTKGTGAKYWYGYINNDGTDQPCVDEEMNDDFPTCRLADGSVCPAEDMTGCCDPAVEGDCVSNRGWWSSRFDAQFILYDPADLARVASGEMEPWEPQPYATVDIDEHLYLNAPEDDRIEVGWGDQRRSRVGAAAYDREHGYLYVLELYADGAKPVVHVWKVD